MNTIYLISYDVPVSHQQDYKSEINSQEYKDQLNPIENEFRTVSRYVSAKSSAEAQVKVRNAIQSIKHYDGGGGRFTFDHGKHPELREMKIVLERCIE